MRPPPKRAAIRQARGHDPSAQAKGPTPSTTDAGVRATLAAAAAAVAAASSALNDGLGAHDQPSSGDFRVGDGVLASTAGKPAQEATVVAVDTSNGSRRFNVVFKDKRRKGGWRDLSELSPLLLPRTETLEESALAPVPPPALGGAIASIVSGEGDGTATQLTYLEPGNKNGPETAAARSPKSSSTTEECLRPALGQRSTTAACVSSLAAQAPSQEIGDTPQPGLVSIAATAVGVNTLNIGDLVFVSLDEGSPRSVEAKVVRVNNARNPEIFKLRVMCSGKKEVWREAADVVLVSLPPQACDQEETGNAVTISALEQPPPAAVAVQVPAKKITDTHLPESETTAAVPDFAVGDRVLVSLNAGTPCGVEAKVVIVDNSRTPARFKFRLKGSGNKMVWRVAADVVPVIFPPRAGGQGPTGKEAGGEGISERETTTVPVAETATATDIGSKNKPRAGGRKAGKKTSAKRQMCPPPSDTNAGEATGRALPTPDLQGGKSKDNHKSTDDNDGSVTPLTVDGARGQSSSSAQDLPMVESTERLATEPGSRGRRGGARNSAKPASSRAELGRAEVGTEVGTPELGRRQRQQQQQQQQQKQPQKHRQKQKREVQPAIDAPVAIPGRPDGASQGATVMEAETSNSPSLRDSTRDRRKEGARETAEESESTADASVPTIQEESIDGPEQAQARKPPAPSDTAENAARKAPGKKLPHTTQDGETDEAGGVGRGSLVVGATRGGGLGNYWQNLPPRKRTAAPAAASVFSLSRSRRVSGRRDARESDSAKKNDQTSKGTGTTKRNSAGKVVRTPRKLGRGLKQRPKVVTPGSAQGRSEPALRTTHPTKAMPRIKPFKVQQARVARKARNNRAPPSPPTTITTTTHRPEIRRPLGQPMHSLEDERRGKSENDGQSFGGGQEDGSDVRRGRRTRKQVHPSLSEDMISAAFGDDDDEDYGISRNEGDVNSDSGGGDASLRFRRSGDAPWGSGDKPLIKVRLSLLAGGAPLNAHRSALAVVTFALDRHRYSGEQLANVLTAEGILCYSDETTRVFVLTQSKEADQKQMLKRVQKLALDRCGAKVEVASWLAGRPALDEFLDNHRRVLDLIVRHRLAGGMWSEVNGVFFNALFCGRRAKRTFNGVRLGINLAASHNGALETGVWELWVTVEPVVHRFSPVDWWALIQEKEEKGLRDFSGSASDDLEERLQVVCLPKLSRGVVYDVKEDAFEMDRLQEANLKRGYLVGPRSEDEMVEYWRQVHHISLPSSNFVFVKVRIGGMVLTYPSWCVVRAQADVPDAARAMRGRILDAFTDAVDAMEGMTVMETTFSWNMLSVSGGGGGVCGNAPAFVTANGRAVGRNKKLAAVSCVGAFDGDNSGGACNGDNGGDGVSAAVPSQTHDKSFHVTTNPAGLCTPGPTGVGREAGGSTNGGCGGRGREGDDARSGSMSVPVVTPHTMTAPPCHPDTPSAGSNPSVVSRAASEGGNTDAGAVSPESRAAKAAAQASLSVIRKSIIRRRGGMPIRAPPPPAARQDATGAAAAEAEAGPPLDTRLCATPFVIRRPPSSSSSSSAPLSASFLRPASKSGTAAKGGPLDLSRAGTDGNGERDIGCGEAPRERESARAPDTPAAAGRGNPAAQLVTPVTGYMAGGGTAATGAVGLKRNRISSAGRALSGKGPKRGKNSGAAVGGPATAGSGEKDGYPGAGGSGKSPEEASVDGAETVAAAAAVAAAAVEVAAAVAPPSAPTKIVVTFAAAGSLGMGVAKDDTEEGSVVLAGKAPTSAAAVVPNGWRLTEVNGKSARRLGDETIASLLSFRPVDVTFEEIPEFESDPAAAAAAAAPAPAPTAPAAAAPRKRAPAKPKATKGKKPTKGKKAAKVTTVRKTFKVQSRGLGGKGQEKAGGGGSGVGGAGSKVGAGAASAYTVPTLPASTTTATI